MVGHRSSEEERCDKIVTIGAGHVAAWRRSGLSKKAYSEQHKLSYWSMRYWADKLAEADGAGRAND